MKRNLLLIAVLAAGALLISACNNGSEPDPAPSKTQLNAKIDEALGFISTVHVSIDGSDVQIPEYWITEYEMEALENALAAAELVSENTNATASQIANALAALTAALNDANAAKANGTQAVNKSELSARIMQAQDLADSLFVSTDGSDVATSDNWVTQTEKDDFDAAIAAAQAVADDADATQPETNAALQALDSAIFNVNLVIQSGQVNKNPLNAMIAQAQALAGSIVISENGSEAATTQFWLTQTEMNALTAAITAALAVADNPRAIQSEVNSALQDITSAFETADNAKKPGTAEPPYIVRAEIADNARNIVQVTFSKAVSAPDAAKFAVLVNAAPANNAAGAGPLSGGIARRDITEISGSGAQWNLTMASPANYGEILRIESEQGAVGGLPWMPPIIIRNLVTRTKGDFENTPGFYIDGEIQDMEAGDRLLRSAMIYIHELSDKLGQTWTIVLGEDQLPYDGGNAFPDGQFAGSTLIITASGSTDILVPFAAPGGAAPAAGLNSNNVITSRNGLTIIVDRHIVLQGSGTAVLQAMVGGKIILDGGEIRDGSHTNANHGAAIIMGANTMHPHFIMNSGKITGNVINDTNTINNRTPAIVTMVDRAVFVMHDGEISGNTIRGTNTAAPRAGVIGSLIHHTTTAAEAARANGVFITGGEIKDNKVEAPGATTAMASAGAFLISGVFQKTGGIIEGNTSAYTGDINGQIAIVRGGWSLNPDAQEAAIRKANAGENVQLMHDIKEGSYGIAGWLPNLWDGDTP